MDPGVSRVVFSLGPTLLLSMVVLLPRKIGMGMGQITLLAHLPIYARLCSKPASPIYYEVDILIPILQTNQRSEMLRDFPRLA